MPRTSGKTKPKQQSKLQQQNKARQQTKPKQHSKPKQKNRVQQSKPQPFDWTLSTAPERDSAVAIRERLAKIAALMDRGYDFITARRIAATL